MKGLRLVAIIVAILVVGLFVGKNLIAKAAVIGGVKALTGLNAQIARMDVSLLKTAVGISGLRVFNPPPYAESVFIDVPELFVDYDLGALFKGQAHLEELRLHIKEFKVVKSADGRLNVQSVKALESDPKRPPTKRQPPDQALNFHIDVLELKIGTAIYTDESVTPAQRRTFAVNLHERYEHITDPYTFVGLLVSRALVKTSIAQLANFDVRSLQAGVMDTLKQSGGRLAGALTEGADTAGTLGRDAVDAAKDAVETTGDAVQGATDTVKKLFGQ